MKLCVRCSSSRGDRRAMTLIEVIAGIALLGTILATTVLAQARLLRQHQRALLKLQAVEAADRLLAQWSAEERTLPRQATGTLIPSPLVNWQTRPASDQADGALSISIIEFTAVAANEPTGMPPLIRVELAVPPEESP
jgi:prepilin-type N-terminal cleavage/methylation domain-containing protein